jgi:hypothetical protein
MYDIKQVQNVLFKYTNKTRVSQIAKDEVNEMFSRLREEEFDMNASCVTGSLFCLVIASGSVISISIIDDMIAGGLEFGNIYNRGICHRKLLRSLEYNYSDALWSVFIHICQRTNFVHTIPLNEMFDIMFGNILITRGVVKTEYTPSPVVYNILLTYDSDDRIKKNFLAVRNIALRHCIRQKHPEVFKIIYNS